MDHRTRGSPVESYQRPTQVLQSPKSRLSPPMERYLKEVDRYKKLLVLSNEGKSNSGDLQISQWEYLWKRLGGTSTAHQGESKGQDSGESGSTC